MADERLSHRCHRFKHGHAPYRRETRTYKIWKGIVYRCTNPNSHAYDRYSKLGVCQKWLKFENFLSDMGEAPQGRTIERKDNERGYGKDNCRWATVKEQQRNRSDNIQLTFRGKTQCVSAWAEELGVLSSTLFYRIRSGWSVERALNTPVRRFGAEHCVNGHEYTLANTYMSKTGKRCRKCHRDRQSQLRAKLRE